MEDSTLRGSTNTQEQGEAKRKRGRAERHSLQGTPSDDALLRVDQFIPSLLPIGKSTWYRGVKEGKYPKGIILGARTIVWPRAEIMALLKQLTSREQEE